VDVAALFFHPKEISMNTHTQMAQINPDLKRARD